MSVEEGCQGEIANEQLSIEGNVPIKCQYGVISPDIQENVCGNYLQGMSRPLPRA